jgi:hypothetical protein
LTRRAPYVAAACVPWLTLRSTSPGPKELGVDAIVGDHITAVPVEQHEYLPMRRGQRARLAGDRYPMAAPINVASPVEIVCEGDLFASAVAQRHRSSRLLGGMPANFRGRIVARWG